MIENLPHWIEILFIVAFALTVVLFHYANGRSTRLTMLILLWSLTHSVLAYIGFYQITDSTPPRFALVLLPSTAFIVFGLLPKSRNWIAEKRNMKISTLLHSIRLLIEFVLLGLFTHHMIPELMTFEGRNFDIVMGITAPLAAWLVMKQKMNKKALLIWNVIGLGFILFILANGILSAELPFQQFGFEHPNRAINYFPFILLPATIVPIVIWTHLTDIWLLVRKVKPGLS